MCTRVDRRCRCSPPLICLRLLAATKVNRQVDVGVEPDLAFLADVPSYALLCTCAEQEGPRQRQPSWCAHVGGQRRQVVLSFAADGERVGLRGLGWDPREAPNLFHDHVLEI